MKKNCGCQVNCGCGDMVLTTPPSCCAGIPACPNRDPCPETFSAQCLVYTGDTIANLNIQQGDRVSDIIQRLASLIINPGCAYPTSPCQSVVSFYSTYISATTIKLKWGAVSVATSYQVEYRLTTSPTWILNAAVAVSPTPVDIIGGLLPNSTYFVRVNTFCAAGNCYSMVLQITTTA